MNPEVLNLDEIVTRIKESIMQAGTEEDIRIWVSNCIESMILRPLGITLVGRYEYTFVSGGRADALYGHVIIEYKMSGKLSSASELSKAKEQLIGYIKEQAGSDPARFLGVLISDRIAFLKLDRSGEWLLRGPYDVNRETVVKLVEALRGLSRKSLDANELVKEFGPASPPAQDVVKKLYGALLSSDSQRVKMLFAEWKRVFSQATGYNAARLRSNLEKLGKDYGISGDIEHDDLLFSIHTYYSLIMKLLAAEIVLLYAGGRMLRSFIGELEDSYMSRSTKGVEDILRDLESGGVFRRFFNISNFMEGDYFSWYLELLDDDMSKMIARLARALSNYEPATPQLEPETARDLLKRLYQGLLPREIRHDLGEYYTPDWLADLVLDEAGLTQEKLSELGKNDVFAPLNLRILDPACGSGTFLVMSINRLRTYAEEHYLTDQFAEYVLKGITGFDLNPLAVLAAKTNFILAVGDLLTRVKGEIELPVYLSDSLLVESNSTLEGKNYVLRTVVGTFEVPQSVVEHGVLKDVLTEIEKCVRTGYSTKDFEARLRVLRIGDGETSTLVRLYETFTKLDREGKNHIWTGIIRNAFAPLLKRDFDYVVGNPPWINWESLPEDYRRSTIGLWTTYGLTKISGKGLGKVKRDLAALFLVRCLALYVKDGGVLGFLMPFTVFKTQAGAGFRKHLMNTREMNPSVIHDLVTLYPFEGATNRTAAIIVEKKARPSKRQGVRCVIWNNTGKPIQTDAKLSDVVRMTERHELSMFPIVQRDVSSPWAQLTEKSYQALEKVLGKSHYEAHEGVNTALNQVYFVEVKGKTKDGLVIVTNPHEAGQKKSVTKVECVIEPALLYPLLRGKDVGKWFTNTARHVIIPHDVDGSPLPESKMRTSFPFAWEYFMKFKDELSGRSIHKLWGKGKPFYAIYDIGPYTFTPYKVVWRYISGKITGKATDFFAAVVGVGRDTWLGDKCTIPNEKLMIIPFEKEDEAYFVAGILNSTISKLVISSYTVETEISTHVLSHLNVPEFNPKLQLHLDIAEISRRAHELAERIHGEGTAMGIEPSKVEAELNKLVYELYGLSSEEAQEVDRAYNILKGEETGEEDVQEEESVEPTVTFVDTVLKPNTPGKVTLRVTNPAGGDVEVEISCPWGKYEFKLVEGDRTLDVPALGAGPYPCSFSWTCAGDTHGGDFTVVFKEDVPHRKRRGLARGG